MKLYKRLTYIAVIIMVTSGAICLWLHYTHTGTETEFWINVNLSLFGSATLTLLTVLLTYFHERRKTLENFMFHTSQILSWLHKYQGTMRMEEKLKFFLDYQDMDKMMWDSDFRNIDFFFECVTHNRAYIHQNIYAPIFEFGKAVNNYEWYFRWHLDGSAKNEYMMQKFVAELERFLIEKTECDMPTGWDEMGVPTAFFKCTGTQPNLVSNVTKHLAGRYYEIMYGKNRAAKLHRMEGQNEQTENANP